MKMPLLLLPSQVGFAFTGPAVAARMIGVALVLGVTGSLNAQTGQTNSPAPTSGKVLKWDQQPALAAPTNVFYGWNEPSVLYQQLAADDWVCSTPNPVTTIRWWGSFSGWMSNDPTAVLPFDFRVDFWKDQPKGVDTYFSHPLSLIQEIVIPAWNLNWSCAGQDYDPRTGTFESCFLFEQALDPTNWFYQNPMQGTNIYWISISADYGTVSPPYPFGWKTLPRSTNSVAPDAAVDIYNPNVPFVGATYVSGNPITWPTTNDLWDLAFELDTNPPSATAKWMQLPDLTTTGLDVDATRGLQTNSSFLLADDFLCVTSGYITNITIWGSWTNDVWPKNLQGYPDPTNVSFLLSIHADIPASNSPTTYSMPGTNLWCREVYASNFVHYVSSYSQEGWMNPSTNSYYWPADQECHEYDIHLDEGPWFYQDGTVTNPKVFWLNVQARTTLTNDPARFGWKTSFTNWNDAAVWVNATNEPIPVPGNWNMLSYPPGHPRFPTNIGLAFQITTMPPAPVKWSQPPVVATNPGNWYNGWNEPSVYGNYILYTNIVADDWLCTNSRPVTDFHWWGSFLGWPYTNWINVQLPDAFHLAIWTDVPTNANNPFSHPGEVIWTNIVSLGDPNLQITGVGYDLDPRTSCLNAEACFKFDYSLPSTNLWFPQSPGTNIYWLSIAAIYNGGYSGPSPFGWKTRPHTTPPPDDAVRVFTPSAPMLYNTYYYGQPIEFPSGTGWDMAFQLTTCQQYPLTNTVFTNIIVTNFTAGLRRVTMKWNAQAGEVYQLQQTVQLGNPAIPWTDLGDLVIGPACTIVLTNTMDMQHFYRLCLPDICP
jgi:hypothetical protein